MITNTVSGSSKSGGLLVQAYKAGAIEEIQWVDLQVGDLIVSVAADAVRGPLLDRKGVRLPITYQEQVALCRELGCVSQTQAIADAMFARAGAQLNFVPLVRTAADSMKMASVDFSLRFHDGVEKQLASTDAATRGLAFGAWKLWILHPRIVERGAINYGFWDKSKKPAKPIQSVGGQHDAAHYDYSQVFQPVKRYAKHATTGETVDLLEHFEKKEKIPARYLLPYKEAPTQSAVSFGFDTEPAEVDIVETLTAAGVNVKPADGWKTRGRTGFTPEGIMVHHTAGPKKGDAPTLGICIAGRPDLSGPLCHIVLARSGTAHVIAANIANHAGKGAQQVLDAVKKDEPVVRNAQANKYVDSIGGNQFFYGIEVENAGVADDPYPEEQVQALARICAALCQAHGWSANRVIHHRQWTSRKIDMSYKGDLPGLVAQFMDAGACSFALEWSEEDAGELSENPEDPISSSDGEDDAAPTQTAAQTATQTATQTAAPADKKVSTPRKRKAPKSKKSAPKLTKGKARPAAKKAAAKRSTRPAAKKAAKRAAPAKKAAKRAAPAKKAAKKAAPAKKAAKKAAPAKKAAKRKAGAAKAKKRSG